MAGRSRMGSPGGRSLPMLRDDYRGFSPDDSYGRSSRYDIEDRLALTERNTQQLMEKAYRIKEDLMENLNMTQGSWQEEKANRELMQEHIKTITDVVRKLSREISQIEHQITAKGSMNDNTNSAIKNLEVSHVAGITDLRGRVGRCDGAIAKLAGDVKTCFHSIKSLNSQGEERAHRLEKKVSQFEHKMNEIGMKIDRMMTEQQLRLRHVEGDSSGKIVSLDNKTRQLIEETRTTMNTFKAMEEGEREKLETRLLSHTDRLNNTRDVRLEKIEQRLDEGLLGVNRRVVKLEEDSAKDRIKVDEMRNALESKVNAALDAHHRRQTGEITRLKKECREGFATVHESISHMKQVTDGKRKLLEEQIRKEIAQIRKMVVLI